MKTRYKNISKAAGALMCAALLLSGCDVTDPIYDTPYPDQGQMTLATTWGDTNLAGAPAEGYAVSVGDYSATVTANPAGIDRRFDPGIYTAYVHTAAAGITVGGSGTNTVATVATATAPPGASGTFVDPAPAFLYSGTQSVTIEKDKTQEVTVAMRQDVRELTLVITPTGDAVGKLTSITATLSGVAGAWNLDSDAASGDAVSVAPVFAKQADGRWTATVRLLGITGAEQVLEGTLSFTGGLDAIAFSRNLHDVTEFAVFNSDKKTPLGLGAQLVGVHGQLSLGDFAAIPGWTGSEEEVEGGVRGIFTASDLVQFSRDWNAATSDTRNDVLARWSNEGTADGTVCVWADIDMSAVTDFTPIGYGYNKSFTGKFDGRGHTIGNLTIDMGNSNYVALFGYLEGASVSNIVLKDCDIKGNEAVGGIAGSSNNSTITGCTVTGGTIEATTYNAGGIAGYNSGGSTITGCTVTGGTIEATTGAGGIAGENDTFSTITGCTVTGGTISATSGAGGIVGRNRDCSITGCTVTGGTIEATNSNAGGIAGVNQINSRIAGCIAAPGSVTAGSAFGVVAGYNESTSTVSTCFWSRTVTGATTAIGLNNGMVDPAGTTVGTTPGTNGSFEATSVSIFFTTPYTLGTYNEGTPIDLMNEAIRNNAPTSGVRWSTELDSNGYPKAVFP